MPQARSEYRLADGKVVIGRGDECDWKIDDPQMFVSRRHCMIQGAGGQYQVTDESRGGLFRGRGPGALGHRGHGAVAARHAPAPGRFRDPGRDWRRAAAPPPRPQRHRAACSAMISSPRAPRRRRRRAPPACPTRSTPRAQAAAPAAAEQPAAPAFFDDPFSMDHGPRAVTPAPRPCTGQPRRRVRISTLAISGCPPICRPQPRLQPRLQPASLAPARPTTSAAARNAALHTPPAAPPVQVQPAPAAGPPVAASCPNRRAMRLRPCCAGMGMTGAARLYRHPARD